VLNPAKNAWTINPNRWSDLCCGFDLGQLAQQHPEHLEAVAGHGEEHGDLEYADHSPLLKLVPK
jgi:hypothetical protein